MPYFVMSFGYDSSSRILEVTHNLDLCHFTVDGFELDFTRLLPLISLSLERHRSMDAKTLLLDT